MSSEVPPPNPDPILNVSITPELIEKHGLTPEEYEQTKVILGREPNLTELGIFSVMWSEHCSYKNSKPLLKLFPNDKVDTSKGYGKVLVKAGEENAGVIDVGDGWAICFKIESHNHPSAVEPFEGAATGVGGIIRDIFTMGARPVALTNSLRFGELDSKLTKRLFRGVVHGISHYGNCMGIPNVGGDIYFDSCYEGNPLVNAQCMGVLRHDQIKRGAATGVGNPVYYVGAATGRDGLGGASFASRELTEESAADRPAVQKGDPFMEKLLLEACLEMMAIDGLVVGIQDMGAAGLTCSTCETASRGGTGIEIELDKVPQRETGMNSYEIMLSESQERMLVIVQKGREKELEAVFEKWDLHAVEIGVVTDTGQMVVNQHGKPVVNMPAAKLADDGPIYYRDSVEPEHVAEARKWSPDMLGEPTDEFLTSALPKLLSEPTIAEKRWVWEQYDHMVMTGTALEPGSDAAVVRIRLEDGKEKLIGIANDCNHRYCYLNPYRGGQIALAECMRNLACSGAVSLGMTDNLNFGNPNKPEAFYMLKEAVTGMADACKFFDIPVVGGNVSLYNESQQGAIDPTPVVCVAGLIEKHEDITKQFVPDADVSFILVGGWCEELGGSYYQRVMHKLKAGDAPELDLKKEQALHAAIIESIRTGKVLAAHDLAEGGLLVAMTEMIFAPKETFGASLDLTEAPDASRLDALLYGESQSRVLLAVRGDDVSDMIAGVKAHGLKAQVIGSGTQAPDLIVKHAGGTLTWKTTELRESFTQRIPQAMEM